MTILYGSQSGAREALSKDLRKYAKSREFDGKVSALDDVDLSALPGTSHVLLLAATFGAGEPVGNGRIFHGAILSADTPALGVDLNFAAGGLGDPSYAQLNRAARDITSRPRGDPDARDGGLQCRLLGKLRGVEGRRIRISPVPVHRRCG